MEAPAPTPGAPSRRRRFARRAAAATLCAFVLGNALAARHAWAFVTYDRDLAPRARTDAPQRLGLGGKLRALALGVRNPRPRVEGDPGQVGLAFSTLQLEAADGTRLEAWRIPRASPRAVVVCVPGYCGSRSSLLERARAWHDLACEVVLLDPRGVGGSEGDRTSIGMDEAQDVAAAVLRARELVPGRPLLVDGLSQGGAAALRAARAGAAIDGLFLESVFDRLRTTVGHRFEAMGLPATPGALVLLGWGSVLLQRDAFSHAPVDDAAHVRAPAVLVSGHDDPWVRHDEARALQGAFPSGATLDLAASGHGEALGRDPTVWRAAAVRLVATLEAAHPRR